MEKVSNEKLTTDDNVTFICSTVIYCYTSSVSSPMLFLKHNKAVNKCQINSNPTPPPSGGVVMHVTVMHSPIIRCLLST